MGPEAIFFAMVMCSSQSILIKDFTASPFDNPTCRATSEAVIGGLKVQRSLDKANKLYIDPIPDDLKRIGAIALFYKQQKLRLGLYRGLVLEMQFISREQMREDIASQSLFYHWDF